MPTFRTRLTISPQFFLSLAAIVLIFPMKWILSWFAAVVVHETFHYIAMRICCTPITSVSVSITGIKMHTGSIELGAELFCALAGPIGSLSLLALAQWFPYVSVCGFLNAAYNLLPLFPLDGGRAVVCLLKMFANRYSAKIYTGIKCFVFITLLLLAVLALWYNLGLVPLAFVIMLFLRLGRENPLANREK